MESFKWGKVFVTDLPGVDDQHRKLVSMVNNFGEAIADNSSTRLCMLQMFQDLTAYAQQHFKTEEKLMAGVQVDIRHVNQHIRQHTDFVTDLSLLAESMDMDDAEDSLMLLEFLINWLAYHILGTDQNMARQITQINSGLNPQEAYENGEREANNSTAPLVVALSGLFSLVSKRNKMLAELNRTLELRVAERTEELATVNKNLEKISITDYLTALPNRRFAMNQLHALFEESKRETRPLSCMMVDADNFKIINDTYGHDAGDVVLKRLAQELRDSVRSDDLVCRLGGDEFFVICPNTECQGALLLGEQLRAKIAALKVPAGKGHWHRSVSIGVACTTQKTVTNIRELLQAADEAVYEAKRCGRNCVKSTPILTSP